MNANQLSDHRINGKQDEQVFLASPAPWREEGEYIVDARNIPVCKPMFSAAVDRAKIVTAVNAYEPMHKRLSGILELHADDGLSPQALGALQMLCRAALGGR